MPLPIDMHRQQVEWRSSGLSYPLSDLRTSVSPSLDRHDRTGSSGSSGTRMEMDVQLEVDGEDEGSIGEGDGQGGRDGEEVKTEGLMIGPNESAEEDQDEEGDEEVEGVSMEVRVEAAKPETGGEESFANAQPDRATTDSSSPTKPTSPKTLKSTASTPTQSQTRRTTNSVLRVQNAILRDRLRAIQRRAHQKPHHPRGHSRSRYPLGLALRTPSSRSSSRSRFGEREGSGVGSRSSSAWSGTTSRSVSEGAISEGGASGDNAEASAGAGGIANALSELGLGVGRSTGREAADPLSIERSLGIARYVRRVVQNIGKLPKCKLSLRYAHSDEAEDIPPCFLTGSILPAVVNLDIEHDDQISTYIRPKLELTLSAQLGFPGRAPSRELVSISVDLQNGMTLWAKDARDSLMAKRRALAASEGMTLEDIETPDWIELVEESLPSGRYALPLCVQVPKKLPPSIDMAHGVFNIKYQLSVSLTCDNPAVRRQPGSAPVPARLELARFDKPFTMLAALAPTPHRSLRHLQVIHKREADQEEPSNGLNQLIAQVVSPSRGPDSWIIIPDLSICADAHVLLRITLVHRQMWTGELPGGAPYSGPGIDTDLSSRAGIFKLKGTGPTFVGDLSFPLHSPETWKFGTSTTVAVPSDGRGQSAQVEITNSFHIVVETFWATETTWKEEFSKVYPSRILSGVDRFSNMFVDRRRKALPDSFHGRCTEQEITIDIGSIGEERDAVREYRWSDMVPTASGGFRLHNGVAHSSEAGWAVAPPTYEQACKIAPVQAQACPPVPFPPQATIRHIPY